MNGTVVVNCFGVPIVPNSLKCTYMKIYVYKISTLNLIYLSC